MSDKSAEGRRDPAVLRALLDRVQAAKGPDREIDREVARVFGTTNANGVPFCAGIVGVGSFTSSLDDAVRLVEIIKPEWFWFVGKDEAIIEDEDGDEFTRGGRTLALSVLHAFLLALLHGADFE